MISSEKFGKFIAAKRKKLNISQVSMAEKLHVDPKTLSKWENGMNYPDLESANKIAEIFNMSLDDILIEKFDSKLIEDKKSFCFNNIFIFIMTTLAIAFIIIKNLNIYVLRFETPIWLSVIFVFNILSFIIILCSDKNRDKLYVFFAKIIIFLTSLLLFII